MENCLVTKLKASVNNNSLPKLGVLTLERVYIANETSSDAQLGIPRKLLPEGVDFTLTIIGDGYFSSQYGGESIGKEITVRKASSNTAYYTSNGNYKIEVNPKYGYIIASLPNSMRCNVSETFGTGISVLQGIGYYGMLSAANPEVVTKIIISSAQKDTLYYSSEDIGKFVNLTQLYFDNAEGFKEIKTSDLGKLIAITGANQLPCVSGSIEEFVRVQRANGRTSFADTLNLSYIGKSGKVTFDGQVIENIAAGVITWTASTITFRGVTITA